MINDAIKTLESQQEATAKELKASLEMLSCLAETKKRELIAEVDKRMELAKKQDPADSNNQVPPGYLLYEMGETRVATEAGPANGITSAINGLLKNPTENWKKAVGDLATVALNTLLGAGGGASSNTSLYMIAMDGQPASATNPEDSQVVVRIDYCLWTYNFASTGIKTVAQSAVAYFARTSLINYNLIPSELAIEQILTVAGLRKELREELMAKIAKEKAEKGKTQALRAYAKALPAPTATNLARHYAF
jgi:hypothetical protein